ncbi:cache domain-containing protein [Hoeflea olei]|uniref:Double Cache domain-containing protein n=1 Tax=Hoeflea olei TaxID=1480615 RepID=A0A1C1YSF1_9HYPH|nr:cache domain-containing protein [Hoeflea olei]OCW56442.1 hypothetical protein AWJ14_20425 [Hoeflea olei]
MSLDRILSLISASLIAGILLVGGLMMLASERALLRQAQTTQIEDASTVLSTVMDQAATLSASHAETIASNPAVADLLASGDRQALLERMLPLYGLLNASAGINVMHFHTAEMTSFLRVWEPENFGQDLSTFRPMVVAVNRGRRTQKGLELGVKGLSLRAVSPIVTPQGLAGTVEIGVDLTSLLHLAKAATGADYALFLDPSVRVGTDGSSLEGKAGLVLETATEADFFTRLQQASPIRMSQAPQLSRYTADGGNVAVMGRPLLDYSGNLIGTIVIARDLSSLESHLSRALVTIVAVSICGFLIAYPVFMTAIRALLLRPLAELAACCADDADQAPALPASSRAREYLELRAGIEKLQTQLRAARGEGEPG